MTDNRTTEPLPCPFCGGEAVLHQTYDMDTGAVDGWFAWCDNDTCECKPETEQFFTEAEAIAAWNTRAERTCRQEERGWGTEGDHARVWLTCGHDCMVPTVQDLPNYCPNCGARVVE